MNSNQELTFRLARRDDERICEAIVTAVADVEGVSPIELKPLARVVDPDALETLVTSANTLPDEPTARFEFPYSGYKVTVTEDGGVSVCEIDDDCD